jgi:hypothetical protein
MGNIGESNMDSESTKDIGYLPMVREERNTPPRVASNPKNIHRNFVLFADLPFIYALPSI